MSKKLIREAWEYASIAYDEPDRPDYADFLAGAEIIPIRTDTDFAFAAVFRKQIWIAFQGTANLKQWLSNMDVYPLEVDEYKKKHLPEGEWGESMIVNGFYDDWLKIKPEITALFDSMEVIERDYEVIVCGHSRGGALAELCSRHLAKNMKIPNSCFTFGAPAVGTKKYRDQFRMLPINGTRVVNGWDIVPTVPPKLLGFKHGCATKIWNKKSWWKRFIPHIRIKDHLSDGYEKFIYKRFN